MPCHIRRKRAFWKNECQKHAVALLSWGGMWYQATWPYKIPAVAAMLISSKCAITKTTFRQQIAVWTWWQSQKKETLHPAAIINLCHSHHSCHCYCCHHHCHKCSAAAVAVATIFAIAIAREPHFYVFSARSTSYFFMKKIFSYPFHNFFLALGCHSQLGEWHHFCSTVPLLPVVAASEWAIM